MLRADLPIAPEVLVARKARTSAWHTSAIAASTWALFAQACASSDPVLAARAELVAAETKAQRPAVCKPGMTEPCYFGPAGTAGRGVCKEGTRVCANDGQWGGCNGETVPSSERCNQLDDDCNGVIDDPFERSGTACTRGTGACRAEGVYACAPDGASSQCSAKPLSPAIETCDGRDNDCDGQIDEGDVEGAGATCSTGKLGACQAGRRACVAGQLRCVPIAQPGIEVCNREDDDCDGRIDNDCVPPAEAKALLQPTR